MKGSGLVFVSRWLGLGLMGRVGFELTRVPSLRLWILLLPELCNLVGQSESCYGQMRSLGTHKVQLAILGPESLGARGLLLELL